tara:strand:- start:84 stop:188 length:105 start_codon:yes stop_codon:yes gene_type:complete
MPPPTVSDDAPAWEKAKFKVVAEYREREAATLGI